MSQRTTALFFVDSSIDGILIFHFTYAIIIFSLCVHYLSSAISRHLWSNEIQCTFWRSSIKYHLKQRKLFFSIEFRLVSDKEKEREEEEDTGCLAVNSFFTISLSIFSVISNCVRVLRLCCSKFIKHFLFEHAELLNAMNERFFVVECQRKANNISHFFLIVSQFQLKLNGKRRRKKRTLEEHCVFPFFSWLLFFSRCYFYVIVSFNINDYVFDMGIIRNVRKNKDFLSNILNHIVKRHWLTCNEERKKKPTAKQMATAKKHGVICIELKVEVFLFVARFDAFASFVFFKLKCDKTIQSFDSTSCSMIFNVTIVSSRADDDRTIVFQFDSIRFVCAHIFFASEFTQFCASQNDWPQMRSLATVVRCFTTERRMNNKKSSTSNKILSTFYRQCE